MSNSEEKKERERRGKDFVRIRSNDARSEKKQAHRMQQR